MVGETSERHTDILNGYKAGGSRFNDWATEKLGDLFLTDWEWGEIKMRWEIDDRFVMPDGVMFGGHIASVADHVAGLTAMTVLRDVKGPVVIDVKLTDVAFQSSGDGVWHLVDESYQPVPLSSFGDG